MQNIRKHLPWAKPDFWGKEREYLNEALDSTWISGGNFVDRLEKDFSAYTGSPYALTASNGTSALQMAFLALDLKSGDEILIPGYCFLAAANVALHMGLRPVFVEVHPQTWCVTAQNFEKSITSKTKALVSVHTYGNLCFMDEIMDLAGQKGLSVIEDAAESFACRFKGREAGSWGTVGTFSFQATKTITTGEGGMVVTANESLFRKMALYRSHGMLKTRYWHELPGHNFRLTNLQAALGCAQMEKIETIKKERRRVHHDYRRAFEGVTGIELQYFPPEVDPVLWAIAVKLDLKAYPQGRDAVIAKMQEGGIETRNGFYSASLLSHIYPECPGLPICENLSQCVLSLPTYPSLMSAEIEWIVESLKKLRV